MRRIAILFTVVFGALSCSAFLHAQETRQSPHGDLKIACSACHNPDSWKVQPSKIQFDHGSTAFPLVGRHVTVSCRDCHTTLAFSAAATACFRCHQDPHSGQFGSSCDVCHTPAGWDAQREVALQHDRTRFPLSGVHHGLDCQSCHAGGRYTGTPIQCSGCHLAQFQTTNNPSHRSAGFSADCSICHTTTQQGWLGANFTHPGSFALTGGHSGRDCSSCHANGYANTETACVSCHLNNYNQVSDPNHSASHFPQDCSQCHSIDGWRPASFDHRLARFQLTGKHASVDCASCHVGGHYTGTPQDCFSCHQNNYQQVSDPSHASGGYDHNCSTCHTTDGWQSASMDHNLTQFTLVGAHQAVSCDQCHAGGHYNGTPQVCLGCHQQNYDGVQDPNHAEGNYDANCLTCHTMTGWKPATIDHNQTHFPLTGAHRAVACASCHVSDHFNGTATDCYSCHRPDYERVQTPSHTLAQFDHNCTLCHTTDVWKPSTFDHAQTQFPLAGAHRAVDCAQCHLNGQFAGTATDCYSCHRPDYEGVQTPSHTLAQFDHNCTLCHTTDVWKPSTFDHAQTAFPLTGGHRTVDCAQCHLNGQFAGTATDCYSCHRPDYEGVQTPSHTLAQFDHNCTLCHTTDLWKPSIFDHAQTAFPLAGAHRVVDCDQCHHNGQFAGTPTGCYSCHRPDFEGTRDPNHVQHQFSTDCKVCHSLNGWSPAGVNHNQTNFPLTGAHKFVDCVRCHTNDHFVGTPTDCFFCHQGQLDRVGDPDHASPGFSRDCGSCHRTTGWRPANFNHDLGRYPLVGAHRAVDCASCHVGGRYVGTPMECFGCHQQNYNNVQDPNHQQNHFDHNCSTCHTNEAWNPAQFDHAIVGYQLVGAHVRVDCAQCHANGHFANTPTACFDCHQQDYNGVQDPSHQQGHFDQNCSTCHTNDAWRPAQFNHAIVGYELVGAHTHVDCAQCHANGHFANTPTACFDCHQQDYNGVQDPSHQRLNLDHNCTTCHTNDAWRPAQFDHALIGYRLSGAHSRMDCAQCHPNGHYADTPTDCYGCHQQDFNGVQDPNHQQGNFDHNCATCHTDNAWNPAQFDHAIVGYQLVGAHVQVDCAQCHANGRFANTPTDCYSCHVQDYNSVQDPNHQQHNFDHNCATCHNNNAWNPAQFDHAIVGYQLVGAHVQVDCAQCHANGRFANTPTDCYSCHVQNYNGVQDPNHQQHNFDHNCATCHNNNAWNPAQFDHAIVGYQLVGAHVQVDCAQCHADGQFSGTPTDCYSCHVQNYNGVQDPNHQQHNFDHNCATCHNNNAWNPAQFDHAIVGYQLVGAHTHVDCAQCHANGRFAGTPTDCYSCHVQNYNGVQDPNHQQHNFDHNCATCHNNNAWNPAQFDHAIVGYQLVGAHVQVDCAQCHADGQFSGTPTDCYSCHVQNYNGVQDPNHQQHNFDHNCATCHNNNAWNPAQFDHAIVGYQLVGAHVQVDCAQCHANGRFANTPTDCYSCHVQNYNGVQDPNHQQLQYNHNCLICHSTNAWSPAQVNHDQTNFPLIGAHRQVDCAQCHVNGRYAGTPTDCYSCHQQNYNGVQDPNHQQHNLDHNCATCHNNNAWNPAQFDHAIVGYQLVGAHTQVACAQCHANNHYAGTPTDCYSCHQANYSGVQDPNHQQLNFDHNCATCHTNDAWNPAQFDHAAVYFQITGAHVQLACAACHPNGRFAGTPTDCYSCHVQNYNGVQDPNHQQHNLDHNCATCHNNNAWNPALFDHSIVGYRLAGAHTQVACAQCHANNHYAGTPTDCYSCHVQNYNSVQDPNHQQHNFDHNCATCHNNNAWNPALFDHSIVNYQLAGAHTQVACAQCHANNHYAGTPTDCYSCHVQNYNSVQDPNHQQHNFDHNCLTCHTNAAWNPAQFDHAIVGYQLAGAHVNLDCAQCHANGHFANTPTDCYSCHVQNYNGVQDPNHQQLQYNHVCTICHTTTAWTPAQINHDQTNFPLVGAHRQVDCAECHVNGRYAGTPTDCYSCHQANYNGVQDPNHQQLNFDHNCATCHTTTAWNPAQFNHATVGYQITGAHVQLACAACHPNGRFAGTPTACYDCHVQNYNGVQDPNHQQLNFDHNCTICHSTTAWNPAQFDHANVGYQITGAHVQLACAACHPNGRFAGTPTACYDCHVQNYNGVQDPNHQQGNYDHNCTICHSTTAWNPAQFDHSQTHFPLTGAHRQVACAQCHLNGRFAGTPMDCFFCHENDYNNAANPNHHGAGFPEDCSMCHTTTNWNSNFNHDQAYFPIYSGNHRGVWAHCSDCHTNPNDYHVFSCITCHEHNRQDTDNHHREVGGYVYDSAHCYHCHPTGRGGDRLRIPPKPQR